MSATREHPAVAELRQELDRVRARLEEDEEILRAIRHGEVDALVIDGPAGQQVFTLRSAETPYRILIEQMHEGAATLTADGAILYCNRRFAEMLGLPQQVVVGRSLQSVVVPPDRDAVSALVAEGAHGASKMEVVLETDGGGAVPVYLSLNPLTIEGVRCLCLVVTDLTEQKRNEEIVAAERLARSILEHATEAIVVCDAAQRITHANHAVRRLCDGNPIGQPIGAALPLSISTPTGDRGGAGARPGNGWIAAALAGSTVQGIEADLCCGPGAPGQAHRFLVSAGPLYNAQRRIIGCVVTLTDISDRLRAEAALRQSEERLRFALEAARVVAWEWTPEIDRAWHSANAGTIMGLGRREVQGDLAALCGPLPVAGRESVRAALAAALREKREFEYEYRVVLADGTTRWMANRGRVIRNEAGQAVRLAGVSIDITARKQMEMLLIEQESRLRLAIDSVNAGIWDWDTRSDRVYLSPTLKAFLGYGEDLPESNSAWLALVHPEDLPLFKQRARQALTDLGHQCRLEYRVRHKDGTYRWIQSNALVIRDSKGAPVRMTGLDLDITEQKRATLALQESEQRQKRLQQQLLQISRLSATGEVASTLAHELNQPLTATINYVQAARRMGMAGTAEAAERVREFMDKAVGQATRAGTILRRIRAFIAMGDTCRSLESLNEVVREASLLGVSGGVGGAAENDIAVRFALVPDLPPCLMDKVQIQQVVFNLVRNAIEAMAEAKRRELTVRTSRSGSGAVEVTICDTGPGVAPEVADRLFQPFITTKGNGMGLGLAICRSIIENHNGRLWSAANPEGGAIFGFCLPMAARDSEDESEQLNCLHCR